MSEKVRAVRACVSAIVAAIMALLGWKGVLVVCWVVVMFLDYLSGSIAAKLAGAWSSSEARKGLGHKGGMILVVLVAAIADIALATACQYLDFGIVWSGLVLPLVLAWYILTELGSILENAERMGAPVPSWMVKGIKSSTEAIEGAGKGKFEE